MHAQQTEGNGIVSYPDNNVRVVGEKIFWSANPKTDNSSETDLLTVYYKGLYNRRNAYLSGIKGIIDKPGGYIKIEVHAYDSKRAGGLQLLTDDEKTFVTKPIYGVEITQSSENAFSKTTKELNYQYWDHGLQLGRIFSDDIKILGAKSLNAVTLNCGNWAWDWLRAFSLVSSSCSLEIDKDLLIQLENQPVVVKITIKDATLMDVRVPAVEENKNLKSIIGKEYPYLVINKVNVEVLEAPGDNNSAAAYEKMIREAFDWTSKVYTDRTNRFLSEAALNSGAKIGNSRVVFKDVDILIRKGSNDYRISKIENEGKDREIDLATIADGELFIKYVSKLTEESEKFDEDISYTAGITFGKKDTPFGKKLILLSYKKEENDPFWVNTLAHELGHYFGLEHTFEGGCIGPNDRISDTPPAEDVIDNIQVYENCVAPFQCGGKRRLIENIMDYSDCDFMFTPGQVRVIRNTIRTDSPDLYTGKMAVDGKINIVPNFTVRDLRPAKTARRSTIEEETEKSQTINIYPNPVKEILNVYNVENEEYKIFNISGQEVLSGRTQKGQINVGTLPEGMYIIKIKNTNKRFIKE
ncbi:hypothetical protein CFS9_23520 [Flavobacterium sp. CFS9]|uniref:Por secretion system C-terminal sorting domain-containing protein n=2 Tax=Flavobacterium sp. CFS9 TaxID=3143118 RepID=A0AAT9H2L3_9FLAO